MLSIKSIDCSRLLRKENQFASGKLFTTSDLHYVRKELRVIHNSGLFKKFIAIKPKVSGAE